MKACGLQVIGTSATARLWSLDPCISTSRFALVPVQVKAGCLIANPGCYPTCSQLPLYPLVKEKLILTDDIIIDAKSGTTLTDLKVMA